MAIWMAISVLHDAASDARLQRHLNTTFLSACSAGLGVVILIGLTNLPGYLRQLNRPGWDSRSFWTRSSIYNFVLLFGFGAWLISMGRPFEIDASISIFVAFLMGVPLLGLILSLSCRKSKDRHDA
jgi:hypothetical protein